MYMTHAYTFPKMYVTPTGYKPQKSTETYYITWKACSFQNSYALLLLYG